ATDYAPLYRARRMRVSFAASFRDDFAGWKRITIPFSAFHGEEDGELDLSAVQAIGFDVPGGLRKPLLLDQIRLSALPGRSSPPVARSRAGGASPCCWIRSA